MAGWRQITQGARCWPAVHPRRPSLTVIFSSWTWHRWAG